MQVLAYAAAGLIGLWGIAHAVPIRRVVAGFAPITTDNRRVLVQESHVPRRVFSAERRVGDGGAEELAASLFVGVPPPSGPDPSRDGNPAEGAFGLHADAERIPGVRGAVGIAPGPDDGSAQPPILTDVEVHSLAVAVDLPCTPDARAAPTRMAKGGWDEHHARRPAALVVISAFRADITGTRPPRRQRISPALAKYMS